MNNNLLLKKIEELREKEILSSNDKKLLWRSAFNLNSEVRVNVAETLALFPSCFSKHLLLMLANDRNDLVRANACDSLSSCGEKVVLIKLCKRTNDKYYLVRGYAALSLADVQINIGEPYTIGLECLRTKLNTEMDDWVKVCIYRSIILLGDKSVLNDYLILFKFGDYYVKNMFLFLANDFMSMLDKGELLLLHDCLEEAIVFGEKSLQNKTRIAFQSVNYLLEVN